MKTADTLEIRIYKGADGHFDLYEDEGDNYNYEKGNYTIIPFRWDEKNQSLIIGKRQGFYPGYFKKRVFNLVVVYDSADKGTPVSTIKRQVTYTGMEVKIQFN